MMCSFWDASPETIYHAFITCPRASELWQKIETWLREKTNSNVNISDIEKIFGGDEMKSIVGKAILVTYDKRERERPSNINAVKWYNAVNSI